MHNNATDMANLHADLFARVKEQLAQTVNPMNRLFLESELQRHEQSFLYWSRTDTKMMLAAGLDAYHSPDCPEIEYRVGA